MKKRLYINQEKVSKYIKGIRRDLLSIGCGLSIEMLDKLKAKKIKTVMPETLEKLLCGLNAEYTIAGNWKVKRVGGKLEVEDLLLNE